jgi:hypothetical protein
MHARRSRTRQRGQALVEFAMVAPFLFLLLFSIIEFARFIYYTQVLNDATREGARYAIVHGSASVCPSSYHGTPTSCDPTGDSKVLKVVQTYAIGVVTDGDFLIKTCYPGLSSDPVTAVPGTAACEVDNVRGSYVKVTLDYKYKVLIPLVPLPQIPVHAESILVINH